MIEAAILTISDSSFEGKRADRSGPALRERIEALGWRAARTEIVPDEADTISAKLTEWADSDHLQVVLTTGGTGVALRDVTPEATLAVVDRAIPGIGELMRAEGLKSTPYSVLSRGIAGTRGTTLIVNLPGSPRGAVESLNSIARLIPHIVDLLHGKTEHNTVSKH
ncbi:MAG TPA: MogA/MoaB family molybdenum cofactor biosynthesis protein [Bryobacteraceae bacterium]|nr:MogA/MoaB family molybdenum cofactor biosynthesis protein [Bryobacteraceae bacterium]